MVNLFKRAPLLLYFIGISLYFIGISLYAHTQVLDHSWKRIITTAEDCWYDTEEAKSVAENVLLYQRDIGGWPKNVQMQEPLSEEQANELDALQQQADGSTIDNGATVQEMLFLSKIYRQIPDKRYKNAFIKGLNYLLEAQYSNGGWPQFYPTPENGYYKHITYNDDAMVNVLWLLKRISDSPGYYSIVPSDTTLRQVNYAFDKGITCILNTQYKQNGVLTGWCAQHDKITLQPAKARSYELPSLSGSESAPIVLLLMSIDNPSDDVVQSVDQAVAWFEETKIEGLAEERYYDENGQVIDKKMLADSDAPPIWARFMELDDNTPFFCDRDGVKKASLTEIGSERRNGYAWYVTKPNEVLKKYPKWKEKQLAFAVEEARIAGLKDKDSVVVALDGTGDYTSIQAAIDNTKSFPYQRKTIFIKNGFYYEKIKVYEWNTNLTLMGESKEKTIISYDDHFNKMSKGRNSTFHTYTLLVEASDFIIQNLTIQNTAGEVGQAVALSVFSNRVIVKNCNILGNQDTLYASGTGMQYYLNCYIAGTTDFIFGGATAYFENCVIHSKKDSYITAASTAEGQSYGYVFQKCKLTADAQVKEVYLGRPWRTFAQTVFLNCVMDDHILPEGWHNWSNPEAEKKSFYAEYNCTGLGCHANDRVPWAHQLTKKEAKKYSIEKVLNGQNGKHNQNWYLQ